MSENRKFMKIGIGRGRGIPVIVTRPEASEPASSQLTLGRGILAATRGTTRDSRHLAPVRTIPPRMQTSKAGTKGNKVSLESNYFRLMNAPDFEICAYRVDIKPEVDLEALRKSLIFQNKEEFGGYLFDGASMLYLTHRLKQSFREYQASSREGEVYTVSVNHVQDINTTDGSAIQILNLILRRMMRGLKMQPVGRNLYNPEKAIPFPQFKLQLWPGYITSIRQHEQEVLVCAEVSHKVMRTSTIYDLFSAARKSDSDWQEKVKRDIIGSVVLTDYNNKTYRISDIDFNSSPESTFKYKDREITYKEYYKSQYNKEIRDHKQPMLVSKPKARDIRGNRDQVVFLVPELCRETGLTDEMRKNFTMMRALADHTQMNPAKRKEALLQFAQSLHETKDSVDALKSFNTEIDRSLIEFSGRAIQQESMLFGRGKEKMNDKNVDWTNPMKMNPMYETVPLKRWAFLYPPKLKKESYEFLKLMMEVASRYGYELTEPKNVELKDDRISTYTDAIQDFLTKDPRLLMIVSPNNAADRYCAIKKLTCVDKAVPTQVLVSRTITPKKGKDISSLMSIATKVVVQINCKLGGAPWMIKFPMTGFMIVGFDVTHDTRDRSKSVGAFVASMDLKEKVQFFSAVSIHSSGNEESENIAVHMVKALKAYLNLHEYLPEKIFFYRDGVGDGQIEYVYNQEVKKLESTLANFYEGQGKAPPKLTFFIVNKRLNTRFFLKSGSEVSNPVPGTVVDNTVTLPERYDFYLISQSARQGTVAPTSFNIIHDDSGLSADQLQTLTYKLCHLYFNWSGTVRVPAVVQYAHKLAFLVGEFLHQVPSENFENRLYFL